MKNIRTWIPLVLIALSCLSCQKEKLDTLPDDELGACPLCEFTYRKSTASDTWFITEGNSLIFMYKNYWQPSTNQFSGQVVRNYSGLFFEVPVGVNSFRLDKDDMKAGKVVPVTMCPNCGVVAVKAVDGFVKGQKITNSTWLVEVNVVLVAEYTGEISHTIAFNRYFKPE